jgi:hypothetical protein
MLRLCTECCIRRAHPQCVDVTAISKTASAEDDGLETDVGSANGSVDATDRHQVLLGSSEEHVAFIFRVGELKKNQHASKPRYVSESWFSSS